ncbi:MAG: ImuA family protein [Sphingomicrobium sp.]
MAESKDRLSALRRQIAGIERQRSIPAAEVATTGHKQIDAALGGGLARGRLHEVFAIDPADASNSAGFAAMLALRLGGPLVWLRAEAAEALGGKLHAPGLSEIGFDPANIIMGVLPDPLTVLRAAADVMRCAEVRVTVIELWRMPRALDLTASRRLAVAAEASGVTALLLRAAAEPGPSAAHTRWAVRSAASAPLEANAPGHPAMEVELLRQRGRPAGGRWLVEWDRDRAIFRERRIEGPALPGAVVPLPVRESRDAGIPVPLRLAG